MIVARGTRHARHVPASNAAALLLAGGFSRRMGIDKSTLEIDGVPVLQRLARAAAEVCGWVFVLARAEQTLPDLPRGVVRLDDPADERGQGPLWAVARGLAEAARRGATLACLGACDMPLLDADHFAFMLARLQEHAAVAPVDPASGILQPLAGAVRIEAAVAACEHLRRADARALRALFRSLDAHELDASALPHPAAIHGCNTPAEWQALRDATSRS